jgi:hypothetical protein
MVVDDETASIVSTPFAEADELDHEAEEGDVWEYRTAAMALVNALVNSPDDLDERLALREEFARRGLNEVMTVRGLMDTDLGSNELRAR